jgi:hypothetical protein
VHVRRSPRRNFLEKFLGIAVLPYRCKSCDRRFYTWRYGSRRVMDPYQD